MSRAVEQPMAADVYEEYGGTVEHLAERDDEIGAIFRALKTAAGEREDSDE